MYWSGRWPSSPSIRLPWCVLVFAASPGTAVGWRRTVFAAASAWVPALVLFVPYVAAPLPAVAYASVVQPARYSTAVVASAAVPAVAPDAGVAAFADAAPASARSTVLRSIA